MKIHLYTIVLALMLTLVFVAGCSDRGTNVGDDVALVEGGVKPHRHIFFHELLFQIRNEYQILEIASYTPKVSYPPISGGELKPVPTLILLPPQGGDQFFYFNHGLESLADELISTGVIQPMEIVCISNDAVFGGYFYGSKYPAAGNYDTLVGGTLVEYIHAALAPYTINSPAKRGIGGVGMGAYGAFRAALKNPGTFCSVSAVDGPLDFDGSDGNGGFISLFDDALTEQGILNGNLNDFDSSSTYSLAQLFIGGALAFSPHDTALDYDLTYRAVDLDGDQVPDAYDGVSITINQRYVVADSTTLVSSVVGGDENFDFHMPFTSDGLPYQPVWDLWLENNLENLLAGSTLEGVNMWVATTPETRYGYHGQTASWISTLQQQGYPVTTMSYTGYDGLPATSDQYVYDLLRDMLIFHSECFGNDY
ncbi:MAG: alpha/beta hydrolase-fold protein [Candidatus Zixiibacteriota bacterium]